MTKIFTDDQGNKYELAPIEYAALYRGKPIGESKYGLKPIKKELETNFLQMWFGKTAQTAYLDKKLELTEPQAKAVARAIKALMEYITANNGEVNYRELINAIGHTRDILMEDK